METSDWLILGWFARFLAWVLGMLLVAFLVWQVSAWLSVAAVILYGSLTGRFVRTPGED